ncbi:hypothetical protein SDC9_44047 [bioreactor metagenome]|uniref:DUF559 domain-containing protein n=1 Tax=bioreactor metagenome TaxID=1076179 RepID=A0A644W578_9ZZZZ
MKPTINYDPKLKQRAKELRKNSTLSEVLLWQQLKGKKMMGLDFHRQKPIDRYIVDFYCAELMLAIEIDGITHDNKVEYDRFREQRLNTLGLSVLRFLDTDVKHNLAGVIKVIELWVNERRR